MKQAPVAPDQASSRQIPSRGSRSRSVPTTWWEAMRYAIASLLRLCGVQPSADSLVLERDAVRKRTEEALLGVGRAVASRAGSTGFSAPGQAELVEALTRARTHLDAAIAEGSSFEKRRASTVLQLGLELANAETEWRACATRAAGLDQLLANLEEERRALDVQAPALQPVSPEWLGANLPLDRTSLETSLDQQRLEIEERYRSLRERAAALRATTIAARGKFDQAAAARQKAEAALMVSVGALAANRSEAEAQVHRLTLGLGQAVTRAPPSEATLLPAFDEWRRLEAMAASLDRRVERLPAPLGRGHPGKLAVGVTLVVVTVGAAGAGLWALLH